MSLDEIREAFRYFDDWEDKYRFVIDLGKSLPEMPQDKRTDTSLVRGCQSQVWLHARLDSRTGRLHLELGDISKALDSYQDVARNSPEFSTMLFEVAWAHVKAAGVAGNEEAKQKSLKLALRTAELLMASAPDSRLFPESRILEGNLQIRLGAEEEAYDTFARAAETNALKVVIAR